MHLIYRASDGDLLYTADSADGFGAPTYGSVEVPDDWAATHVWDAETRNIVAKPVEPQQMTRAGFVRALGPTRFAALMAATADPLVLYFVELARLAEYIDESEARPALEMLEAAGVLPAGTADDVFGGAQ